MDKDDPEKRITELERQLADTNWSPREDVPPARPADPIADQGLQGFLPQSTDWQQLSPPQPRRSPRTRLAVLLIPGVVLLGAVGLVLALVLHFNPFPSGPTQLHTAEGLTALLNEVRDHFGDTMGYELAVHPERAFIDRVNPQENRAELRYQYRSGDWSEFGDPTPADGSPTDLSNFDTAGVAAALASAPQTLTITQPKNVYLIVESGGENLSLAIHVSGGGVSGHMEINADGTIKKIYPPS